MQAPDNFETSNWNDQPLNKEEGIKNKNLHMSDHQIKRIVLILIIIILFIVVVIFGSGGFYLEAPTKTPSNKLYKNITPGAWDF